MTTYTKAGRVTGHLEPVPSYEEYALACRASHPPFRRGMPDFNTVRELCRRIPDDTLREYDMRYLYERIERMQHWPDTNPCHLAELRHLLAVMKRGHGASEAFSIALEERRQERMAHQARETEALADSLRRQRHTAIRLHRDSARPLDTAPPPVARGIQGAALAAAGILAAAMWLYFF